MSNWNIAVADEKFSISILPLEYLIFLYAKFFYLDFESGEVLRQIPVSCLTSDIAMGSNVVKLSLDNTNKVYKIVSKVNIENNNDFPKGTFHNRCWNKVCCEGGAPGQLFLPIWVSTI